MIDVGCWFLSAHPILLTSLVSSGLLVILWLILSKWNLVWCVARSRRPIGRENGGGFFTSTARRSVVGCDGGGGFFRVTFMLLSSA